MKHNQVLWSMLAFLFYQVINLFRLRPQVLGCCFQCWFSLQSFCSALRACLTRTELCGPSETREGVCPAAHSQRCSAGSLGSGDSVNKESRWGKAGELQNMYSIIPYLWKKKNSVYVPPSAWKKGLVSSKKGRRILVRGWCWKELFTLYFWVRASLVAQR